jgi:hypothetical protein
MTISAGLPPRRRGWMPGIVAFGLLGAPQIALAAPFCLTSLAISPQCIYYDAHQCQSDSARQGGWCTTNPNETRVGVGSGQYCVVPVQGVALCNFLDRESCAAEATRQHGICYHDEARAAGVPDPYAASGGPTAPPGPGTP